MKNTKAVFHNDEEFECVQNFNIDTQSSNVDVYRAGTHEYIGEIVNLVIPDPDFEEEDHEIFDEEVRMFIDEKINN